MWFPGNQKPCWIILARLDLLEKNIMAAIDDLKAAEAAETAELSVVAQAVTDEIARVEAVCKPPGGGGISASAAQAEIMALNGHVDNLKTIAAQLTAERPTA